MSSLHHTAQALYVAAITLTAGCATSSAVPNQAPSGMQEPPASESVPLVRYGRYRLIELTPELAQRDLMQQVIDVSIPATVDATVGDALRHVLLRTGYRFCESPVSTALYDLPLPAAHLHLGPLILRDALITLAGPAWDLDVDDVNRQVCFTRRLPTDSTANTANAEGRS